MKSHNWQRKKIRQAKAHQLKAFAEINELLFKKRVGRELTLTNETKVIEFVSCSYLGLDMNEKVIKASCSNLKDYGVTFPAARTRIQSNRFIILENLLNKVFLDNFTVLFQTLHLAHLGFIPLLASGEMPSYPMNKKGVVFILDKNVHASIQINRGLMQQFGEVILIETNNLVELDKQLKEAVKKGVTPITMLDSVGSMGGLAKIPDIMDLIDKYEGYAYFDDAHGTSVFGKHGSGFVLESLNNVFHPRLILASSLSKGFGAVGGVLVLPTKQDAEVVRRFASTYIFGGPPPLAIVDAAIASANIHLSEKIYQLQDQLKNNLKYFDMLSNKNRTINLNSPSPIRGIAIGNEFKTIEMTSNLRKEGFAVTGAMYPTVPKDQGMIRMVISAAHTYQQLEAVWNCLNKFFVDDKIF